MGRLQRASYSYFQWTRALAQLRDTCFNLCAPRMFEVSVSFKLFFCYVDLRMYKCQEH